MLICCLVVAKENLTLETMTNVKFSVPVGFRSWFSLDVNGELMYRYLSDGKYNALPLYMRACPSEPYGAKEGENDDYTDVSVRAMLVKQDGVEKVMVTAGHLLPNRMIGDNFNNLKKVCKPVWKSLFDPNFETFKYNEWYTSCYTKDGVNIMAIAQHDWHAGKALKSDFAKCTHPLCQLCKADPFNCWWLGLTIMKSIDGGETYTPVVHNKLAIPDISSIVELPSQERLSRYYTVDKNYTPAKAGAQAVGYYQTTNIIKGVGSDPNYYFITRFRDQPQHPDRNPTSAYFVMCRALSSANLLVGSSWKGYTPSGFTGKLLKGEGTAPTELKAFREIRHISFNLQFNKYLIFGFASYNNIKYLAYMLSTKDNILEWDPTSLTYLIPATYEVDGFEYEIRYPTLIDHDYPMLVAEALQRGLVPPSDIQERRNFDLTGKNPFVYCTIRKDQGNNHLDLVRFQITLT